MLLFRPKLRPWYKWRKRYGLTLSIDYLNIIQKVNNAYSDQILPYAMSDLVQDCVIITRKLDTMHYDHAFDHNQKIIVFGFPPKKTMLM